MKKKQSTRLFQQTILRHIHGTVIRDSDGLTGEEFARKFASVASDFFDIQITMLGPDEKELAETLGATKAAILSGELPETPADFDHNAWWEA